MVDPKADLPPMESQAHLNKTPPPGISSPTRRSEELSRPCSSDPTTTASSRFDEKVNENSHSDEKVNENDHHHGKHGNEAADVGEIVYHYLSDSTQLPNPTSITPSRESQAPPSTPPDLKKYMSPFKWSQKRKNIIMGVACVITSLTAFTAGAYSPAVGQLTKELHVGNVAALVGITTFTFGKSCANSM
jgi:hypothetical protein